MVKKRQAVTYQEAYKMVHAYFPDFRDFEGIVSGAVRSGYISLQQRGNEFWLVYEYKNDK
jgi:hypothetical protein